MLVIGIAGGSGSGKTTVLEQLVQTFDPNMVSVLYMDSYYKDNSHLPPLERRKINFDHPDSIDFELLQQHIIQLKNGEAVEQPVYDFVTNSRTDKTVTVEPSTVILLEGILIFAVPALVELLDIKVFVDTDADERALRILERDIRERGQTVQGVIERYALVKKMHYLFVEPSRLMANISIPMNNENKVGVEILISVIRDKLQMQD